MDGFEMSEEYDHYHKENEWGVCRTCAQTTAKLPPSARTVVCTDPKHMGGLVIYSCCSGWSDGTPKLHPEAPPVNLMQWLNESVRLLNLYAKGFLPDTVAADFLSKVEANWHGMVEELNPRAVPCRAMPAAPEPKVTTVETGWISVEERLPGPDPLSDIVFGSTGESVGLYRYWWRYGQFERLTTPEGWNRKVNLTHWMPLPDPPALRDDKEASHG